ncbi:MAG: hypothetical protein DRN04_10435 [Thermoprotei archaeon]|nr:MAG: hypothetical protein DRN04_10435 [Thermoprotei archaeon]
MSEAVKILQKKISKVNSKKQVKKKQKTAGPKIKLKAPRISLPKKPIKPSLGISNLSEYIAKLKENKAKEHPDLRYDNFDLVEKLKEGTFGWKYNLREVYVWPKVMTEPWLQIYPLVRHPKVKEVFIRGKNIGITTPEGRFKVIFPENNLIPEKIIMSLAIYSGAQLSISKPHAEADYNGWRILLSLPEVSIEPELVAVRLQRIPQLTEIVDRELAARLILLMLSKTGITITGPSGSGKTTLLNSMLFTLHRLFPYLRICIVEARAELQLPSSPLISRSRGENLTQLIRDAFYLMRPDILVLGELRGEEILSWIEVCRAGIPSITTYHSPSVKKAVESLAILIRSSIEKIEPSEIPRLFDVFIKTERKVSPKGFNYTVSEIYISDGNKFNKIYPPNILDKKFLKFIDSIIVDGDAEEVYSYILKNI